MYTTYIRKVQTPASLRAADCPHLLIALVEDQDVVTALLVVLHADIGSGIAEVVLHQVRLHSQHTGQRDEQLQARVGGHGGALLVQVHRVSQRVHNHPGALLTHTRHLHQHVHVLRHEVLDAQRLLFLAHLHATVHVVRLHAAGHHGLDAARHADGREVLVQVVLLALAAAQCARQLVLLAPAAVIQLGLILVLVQRVHHAGHVHLRGAGTAALRVGIAVGAAATHAPDLGAAPGKHHLEVLGVLQ
mmetsp:Transcript_9383/g.15691  ORF Transcript_9383/g.15691 Transcript_9383/m.15691 type:complete len:246 (-) Transcript_9383:1390-2127(-)